MIFKPKLCQKLSCTSTILHRLPPSSLYNITLSSAVLGTETFGVCRCWQKQWESHRLGSKNLKALFYSVHSDLTWVRERTFQPLQNIHSNCSFPKRKIFPGRLPQSETLLLQLRAEVVFEQEGEEQAHSAILCAWKAASELLVWFFSSSRGHGVAGCVFVTHLTQSTSPLPIWQREKVTKHLVDLHGELWEQSPWTHTHTHTKVVPASKNLGFF